MHATFNIHTFCRTPREFSQIGLVCNRPNDSSLKFWIGVHLYSSISASTSSTTRIDCSLDMTSGKYSAPLGRCISSHCTYVPPLNSPDRCNLWHLRHLVTFTDVSDFVALHELDCPVDPGRGLRSRFMNTEIKIKKLLDQLQQPITVLYVRPVLHENAKFVTW